MLNVIERPRCDCCEQPIHGESYPSQDHEATICARCCVELLGGQVERLDRQLAGAVAMRDAAETQAGRWLASPSAIDQEYGRKLSAVLDAAFEGQ